MQSRASLHGISQGGGQIVTCVLPLTPMSFDEDLDATGLLCPLPVLKAAKRLRSMSPGQVLRMTADDPAAIVDVPHFCTEHGHALLSAAEASGIQTYVIRRKA